MKDRDPDDYAVIKVVCDECGNDYPLDSHCEACGLPLIPECYKIPTALERELQASIKVLDINQSDHVDIDLEAQGLAANDFDMRSAYYAGLGRGLDMAIAILEKNK